MILNRAKEYYKNNKDKINKQAREKYNNSPEEKLKILEYGKNRYHNMYEAEKNKQREARRNRCRNMTEEQKN